MRALFFFFFTLPIFNMKAEAYLRGSFSGTGLLARITSPLFHGPSQRGWSGCLARTSMSYGFQTVAPEAELEEGEKCRRVGKRPGWGGVRDGCVRATACVG